MLKCRYCGAEANKQGTPWKNQNTLNLHEERCKLVQAAKENKQQNEQQDDGCKHAFKVLNPSLSDHARAMNAGYRKHCPKCGDLA